MPQPDAAQGEFALARYLDAWAPAPVTLDDPVAAGPVAALSQVLDQEAAVAGEGEPLPPLWHWLHFLEWPAQRELGTDGHPAHGHFLPPLPDRRRMFAGGRAEFTAALRVGVPARRTSSLAKVEIKRGRTGEMAFVTVRHEITQEGETRVTEEQDLVYRVGEDEGRSGGFGLDLGEAEPSDADWRLALRPSPTLLFRYSALTANAHRIHYDAPYVRDVEGYPGLVVHGPLLVQLMLELARREAPEREIHTLSYRLRKPVFAGEQVCALGDVADDGRSAALRIATRRDERHATAEVTFK
ncbi:MaoC family dehydratase N-terminal domain-containing protein [Streptomyces sp. NPDC056121]|uniref:FAS1-like dehydratase domain-containing protein n=1 Tax=Streptomyces TaxID=1883 RepID=UPI001D0B2D95|nr:MULTISPECIES: MaoC family dehydratase N-terminal domain-containing protein [Streptomyces]MCX5085790.1 MaoC family dehydratase N-terminal domain-containing protein [Streptomyces sp. NBC_00401]UDM03112.1 MaoC family dehydratase N-terminal domain-containing protein [Streptomyces longhuiensis]